MHKYNKLNPEILLKKLLKFNKEELPSEQKEEFSSLDLSSLDKERVLYWINTFEELTKNKKKEIPIFVATTSNIQILDEHIAILSEKKKFNEIIPINDFKNLKNAFSIFMEDLSGNTIYDNIDFQFLDQIKKYPSLRLFSAIYKYPILFDDDRSYLHKNTNRGFTQIYSESIDYLFVCFRLIKDPIRNMCVYTSYWIVNSNDPLSYILEENDDELPFEFKEISFDRVEDFCLNFKRTNSLVIEDEVYLK